MKSNDAARLLNPHGVPAKGSRPGAIWRLALALVATLLLAAASISLGAFELSWSALWDARQKDTALVLLGSRIPRTLSLILAGSALSVAGLIMQMLSRNRFVEPSTAGTAEAASLGILVATIVLPGMPLMGKMLVAAGFALAGTFAFFLLLSRVQMHSILIVPLIGLMLGAVIESITVFLAQQREMLQSLAAWSVGDFSSVLQGRYELLWLGLLLVLMAYFYADRLTVAGMGEAFATNLGLSFRAILVIGLTIVAMITAVTAATVGMVPFLGLIIPNLVSMRWGDNARLTIPWVALSGAAFVLSCDIIGRVVRYPYEIPAGTIGGIVGCAVFLVLLLGRRGARHG